VLNGSNLTISGGGSYAGGINDNNTGSGTLNISAGTLTSGAILIGAVNVGAGNLMLTGSSEVSSLTLNGSNVSNTGNVDLNGYNKLILESNGTNKSSIIATLRTEISYSGYKNSGTGGTSMTGFIVNNNAPASNYGIAVVDNDNGGGGTRFSTFGGIPVDANSVLVGPEILGDADLSGQVDLTDLSTVLNNFGIATLDWVMGNFDGAATIDLTDLSAVLNNFGLTNPHPNLMMGGASRGGSIQGLQDMVASFDGVMTPQELADTRAYAQTIPGYPGSGGAVGMSFALAAAPEPGTLALLAGATGLLVWRRRGARCA